MNDNTIEIVYSVPDGSRLSLLVDYLIEKHGALDGYMFRGNCWQLSLGKTEYKLRVRCTEAEHTILMLKFNFTNACKSAAT